MERKDSVLKSIENLRVTTSPDDLSIPEHIRNVIWNKGFKSSFRGNENPAASSSEDPSLPKFSHQVKEFVQTGTSVLAGIVKRSISGEPIGVFVPSSEYEKRLSTCKSCDYFRHSDERCGSPNVRSVWGCGCYIADHVSLMGVHVPGKARFRDAHCPLTPPKW